MNTLALVLAVIALLAALHAWRRLSATSTALDDLERKNHMLRGLLTETEEQVAFLGQALGRSIEGAITADMVRERRLYQDLSGAEALALVSEPDTCVVDVRTPTEHHGGTLPRALLHPVQEIEKSYRSLPRDRKILLYCAGGMRSASAAAFLTNRGYPDVYNLADGIGAWPGDLEPPTG